MSHDKELIERLALEVAKNISFEHRAPLSDTSIITFATRLLAAYLAERGGEAAARTIERVTNTGYSYVKALSHDIPANTDLFLAPQPPIPEGMALVPIEPTEAMLNYARDWSRKKYGQSIGNDAATGCWEAMINAVGLSPSNQATCVQNKEPAAGVKP